MYIEISLHLRHEHLYEKIERNVIRSDDFVNDVVAVERRLLGSRVLLCTISMLSHLKLGTFTRLVPPQTVIFDEASQIEVGEYFPMLTLFRSTLRKLVFIGDNRQCKRIYLLALGFNLFPCFLFLVAPYGQSDVPNLESIFEKSHLQPKRIFLDTQCTSIYLLLNSDFLYHFNSR